MKINVRTPESTKLQGPLLREVTDVQVKTKKDGKWLYWYWNPEPRADGVQDWGYSGLRDDAEEYKAMRQRLGQLTMKEAKEATRVVKELMNLDPELVAPYGRVGP